MRISLSISDTHSRSIPQTTTTAKQLASLHTIRKQKPPRRSKPNPSSHIPMSISRLTTQVRPLRGRRIFLAKLNPVPVPQETPEKSQNATLPISFQFYPISILTKSDILKRLLPLSNLRNTPLASFPKPLTRRMNRHTRNRAPTSPSQRPRIRVWVNIRRIPRTLRWGVVVWLDCERGIGRPGVLRGLGAAVAAACGGAGRYAAGLSRKENQSNV